MPAGVKNTHPNRNHWFTSNTCQLRCRISDHRICIFFFFFKQMNTRHFGGKREKKRKSLSYASFDWKRENVKGPVSFVRTYTHTNSCKSTRNVQKQFLRFPVVEVGGKNSGQVFFFWPKLRYSLCSTEKGTKNADNIRIPVHIWNKTKAYLRALEPRLSPAQPGRDRWGEQHKAPCPADSSPSFPNSFYTLLLLLFPLLPLSLRWKNGAPHSSTSPPWRCSLLRLSALPHNCLFFPHLSQGLLAFSPSSVCLSVSPSV